MKLLANLIKLSMNIINEERKKFVFGKKFEIFLMKGDTNSTLINYTNSTINISPDLIKWEFIFSLNKILGEDLIDDASFKSLMRTRTENDIKENYEIFISEFRYTLKSITECLFNEDKKLKFYSEIKNNNPALYKYLKCINYPNTGLFKSNDLKLIN